MFQVEVVQRAKTHILCSVSFFLKIMLFMREFNKKYGTARWFIKAPALCLTH